MLEEPDMFVIRYRTGKWLAYRPGEYKTGPLGWGDTKEEAVENLETQIKDLDEPQEVT